MFSGVVSANLLTAVVGFTIDFRRYPTQLVFPHVNGKARKVKVVMRAQQEALEGYISSRQAALCSSLLLARESAGMADSGCVTA